jgi:hypothetical protein
MCMDGGRAGCDPWDEWPFSENSAGCQGLISDSNEMAVAVHARVSALGEEIELGDIGDRALLRCRTELAANALGFVNYSQGFKVVPFLNRIRSSLVSVSWLGKIAMVMYCWREGQSG